MRIRSLLTFNFVLLILYAQIYSGETLFVSAGMVLMSILGGFLLGQVALTSFMVLLMAIVPPEEARSLRSISFNHQTATHHHRVSRSISPDSSFPSALPPSDSMQLPSRRNGKFLSSLLRSDPMNCMPQVMCELSSATEPSDSSGTLNDYMYVMNEILRPDDDDDESGKPKQRSSSKLQGNKQFSTTKKRRPVKKNESDENSSDVSKPSEEVKEQGRAELMEMEEDDDIEGQALIDLVNEDPGDMAYAFADMKKRDKIKDMVKKGEFKDLESYEEPGPDGLFEFGYLPRFDEESYDRNFMRLKKSLRESRALRRSSLRNSRAVQESFVERKKRELQQTDDLLDRVRVGAEVGDFTRSARQCRALFDRCSAPQVGINKAVNTLRRAIVGTPMSARKKGGLNTDELKLLISELKRQQTVTPVGTDVKVVLNIGGQPQPPYDQAGKTPVAATLQTFVPSTKSTTPTSPPPPPPTQNPSIAFASKLEGLQSFLEKQSKEAQIEDAKTTETLNKNGKKPLRQSSINVAVTASSYNSSQNASTPGVFKLDLLPQFDRTHQLPNPVQTKISNEISSKIKKLSKLIDRKIKRLENSDESDSLESSEEISQETSPLPVKKLKEPKPSPKNSKPKPKTQEKGKYKVVKNKKSPKPAANGPLKKSKNSPTPAAKVPVKKSKKSPTQTVNTSVKRPTLKQPRIAIPSPDFYQYDSSESSEGQQHAPYPSFNSFVEQAHHLLFPGRQVAPLPQDPRHYVPSAQRHAFHQYRNPISESPQMTLQSRRSELIGQRHPPQFHKPAYRRPFPFWR